MKLRRNSRVKFVTAKGLEKHAKVIVRAHLTRFKVYRVKEVFYSKAELGNLIKLKGVYTRTKRGEKVYPWFHEDAFKKVKKAS